MISNTHDGEKNLQGNIPGEEAIIFEEINAISYPHVAAYCQKDIPVFYFGCKKEFLQKEPIAEGIRTKKIIDISKEPWDFLNYMDASVAAHKNLDSLWQQQYRNSRSVQITCSLYQTDDLENMYKKDLLISLQKLYYLQLKINSFIYRQNISIFFYPNDHLNVHTGKFSLLSSSVTVRELSGSRKRISLFFEKAKDLLYLSLPFYLALKKIQWISLGSPKKQHFSLGINANLPGLLSFNYHYVDYLIDPHYGFPKGEIIVIDEASRGDPLNEFQEQDFQYFSFFHKRSTVSTHFFLHHLVRKLLPAYLKCCFSGLYESHEVISTSRKILTDYLRWHLFFDLYSLDKHVTVLLPENISKNLIFSEYLCKTIFIHPDNYVAHYHTGWNEDVRTATVHVFMNPDYAVIFGDIVRRYFSYHPNSVKEYLKLGVLASQRVQAIKTGTIPSRIQHMLNEKKLSGKIIGVFDTSYADFGVIKVNEGVRFAEEIYCLLEECPEISIIFKEKKPLSVTPELSDVYERLEQHPRCLVVRKTENDCIFSTDVIAYSDLVISVAYTSTNAEALGARVRAIYYDINGNEKGSDYYFDNYPNFVAHNYQDLKRLVNFWLNEVSDDAFGKFLEQYVKDEIDPYLDMKAVDRLQMFLRTSKG